MVGCVAAVSATESPSQLSPALIQRTWTTRFVRRGFGSGHARSNRLLGADGLVRTTAGASATSAGTG